MSSLAGLRCPWCGHDVMWLVPTGSEQVPLVRCVKCSWQGRMATLRGGELSNPDDIADPAEWGGAGW